MVSVFILGMCIYFLLGIPIWIYSYDEHMKFTKTSILSKRNSIDFEFENLCFVDVYYF